MSSSVTTLDRRAIPSPLYWRSWRNSPLEEPHGPPRRGANPPTVLAALGRPGTPGEAAETIHQPQPAPRRLWKLPELWTQRTRPQLLGKRTERVSHSYHSLHPASLNHRAGKWYRGAPVRRHPALREFRDTPSSDPLATSWLSWPDPSTHALGSRGGGSSAGPCAPPLPAARTTRVNS